MTESRDKRYDDCFALEMTFDGDCFYGMHDYNKDFNVHWTEVATDDDRTWKQKIAYMTEELKKRKTNQDEKTDKGTV